MRVLWLIACLAAVPAQAQKWATTWGAADQGPYPLGIAAAQPDLRFAFPAQDAEGATAGAQDQSFRIIVTPSLWGRTVRVRLSNAFGAKPVTFDGAFIGLQTTGANVQPGSNRPVTFDHGRKSATVAPGAGAWSDPVILPFVIPGATDMDGRRLAVTFHVAGPNNAATGPVTWHALAMQTSYITSPGAGAIGELEDDSAFPNSATSTFFLDALDVQAPADARVVVCLGDGVVDGAGATLNGDDRWTDALARRLRASGAHVAVVNEGLAGNQVLAPPSPAVDGAAPGGPSALARLDRDLLSLDGVTNVIWAEGGNDVSALGRATPEAVLAGMRLGVQRIRARFPGVKVLGATLVSTAGSTDPSRAVPGVEQARQALNGLIKASGNLFDGIIDMEAATLDRATGQMRAEFKPSSTIGGPGDGLTPNRAGYIALADAVDLKLLLPAPHPAPRRPPPPRPAAPAAAPAAAAAPTSGADPG